MHTRLSPLRLLLLSLATIASLSVRTTAATTYYVDPSNGDDANPGSFTQPYRSIHRALSTVQIFAIEVVSGQNVRIVTEAPHYMAAGQQVIVSGVTGGTPDINGTFTIATVEDIYRIRIPIVASTPGTGGIVRKAGTASPGDTVLLRGGTYRSPTDLANAGAAYQIATNVPGGSAGQPITLAAYPGEKPIIKGSLRADTSASLAQRTLWRPSDPANPWELHDAGKNIWRLSHWMCDANGELQLRNGYSYSSNPQQVFVSELAVTDPDVEKTDGHALFQVNWPTTAATSLEHHYEKPRVRGYTRSEISAYVNNGTPLPAARGLNTTGSVYNGPDGIYNDDFASTTPEYKGYPFEGEAPNAGEYTFFYEEEDIAGDADVSTIYIRLPAGVNPNQKMVEVSVSPVLIRGAVDYVHLKDLTFRHTNSAAGWSTSAFGVGLGSIIETCDVQWCDYIGVTLGEGSVMLNSRIDWCGKNGVSPQKDSRTTNCYIGHGNYRNWHNGWDTGGFSKGSTGSILENSELAYNYGPAVWFDYVGSTLENPIVIRNNDIHDNVAHYSDLWYDPAWDGRKDISSIQAGNPAIVTSTTAHGYLTGHVLTFVETSGTSTDINNRSYEITVTGTNTFTIPVNLTAGGSGGKVGYAARDYRDRTQNIVLFEVSNNIQCYGNLIRNNIGHSINFNECLEVDVHDNIIMNNNADGSVIESPVDGPAPWNHVTGINGGRGPAASNNRFYRNIFYNNVGDGYIWDYAQQGSILALGVNTTNPQTSANNICDNNIYSFPAGYTLADVITTTTANAAQGSSIITVASTAGIAVGQSVWAITPYPLPFTTVTAINGNAITISVNLPTIMYLGTELKFGLTATWSPQDKPRATFSEWQDVYGYDYHSRVIPNAFLAFLDDINPSTDIGALARSIATQWTYPISASSLTHLDAGSSSSPSLAFGNVTAGETQHSNSGIFFDPTVAAIGLSISGEVVATFDQYGVSARAGDEDHVGYGFDGASDGTGIYLKSTGPDVIGIATDGVERMTIGSAGITFEKSPALRGYLSGMELANNSITDTNNDIDIGAGIACDSTGAAMLASGSTMTKQIDANWAAGTGNGGMFYGTVATSTWYHVFAILKDSDGSVDFGFDTSFTAANIPAGYTRYRRLGSVYRTSTGMNKAFKQVGDWFRWVTLVKDVDQNVSTLRIAKQLTVPRDVQVRAVIRLSVSASGGSVLATQLDETDSTASVTFNDAAGVDAHGNGSPRNTMELMTDTSGQIGLRAAAGGTPTAIHTRGWFDTRGK